MLKFYLMLQARRLHRMVVGMGGYPILNYLVTVSIFLVISFTMFFNIKQFSLIYPFIALWVVSLLSNPEQHDFLKLTYSRKDYYRIRIMENTAIAFPFVYFLCCSGKVLEGLILIILSALMVLFNPNVRWRRAIPTPFGKYPYEFITGFRVMFIFFLLAYFLTYISLRYANIGIGIFAIIGVSFVCTSFYIKVEDEFYVWIFSSNARKFMLDKLRIAAYSFLFLCLPILIALIISNPGRVLLIMAFQIFGLCYVIAGVLCKYSSFPGEIQTREGLLLFPFSLFCPPLLLFVIPYLYKKSVKSLEGILG